MLLALFKHCEGGAWNNGGFLNPEIVPVVENGQVVDYKIEYCDNYLDQMLEYGKKYNTL